MMRKFLLIKKYLKMMLLFFMRQKNVSHKKVATKTQYEKHSAYHRERKYFLRNVNEKKNSVAEPYR